MMIEGARSHPLPPYRGLLAVDVVSFTGNRDRYLPELKAKIPEVLKDAFTRSDLTHIWQRKRFPELPGDGYVFGVETEYLPFLIHPFLGALQETLWDRSASLRATDRALTMRLRVSINVGPVPDEGDPLRDRASKTTNDTFRLLACRELKDVMDCSEPDITLVGAIVSQRVFQDVVLGGYTPLHEREFRQVTAEVSEKGFRQEAWIYIPRPSPSDDRPPRDGAPSPQPRAGDGGAGAGDGARFYDKVNNAITGGTFTGPFAFDFGKD